MRWLQCTRRCNSQADNTRKKTGVGRFAVMPCLRCVQRASGASVVSPGDALLRLERDIFLDGDSCANSCLTNIKISFGGVCAKRARTLAAPTTRKEEPALASVCPGRWRRRCTVRRHPPRLAWWFSSGLRGCIAGFRAVRAGERQSRRWRVGPGRRRLWRDEDELVSRLERHTWLEECSWEIEVAQRVA